MDKLKNLPHVKEVRGMGLMIGVEFDDTIGAVDVKHGAFDRKMLITAIGASYFLQNVALLLFGSTKRSFPSFINVPAVRIGALTIKGESLVTLLITMVIMIALTVFINKSKTGKAMRAVSEDKDAAELMGINVNRTISITFAIGFAVFKATEKKFILYV